MSWKKSGRIFTPNSEFGWMTSHAQVPTAYAMEDRIRIFFSTRDAHGKSLTACIDLDKNNPKKIKFLYENPALNFGKAGTFDDDGVMPSCVIFHDQKFFLYYSGWNQRVNVPYHNAMGVAVSNNGINFDRVYDGPIMDRTMAEPYLAVTPTILKENDQWKMWYISGIKWELIAEKYEPIYVIKYAYSDDGITWQRPNITCIPQQHEYEAFSRPCVLKLDGVYHMWYCYRNSIDFRDGTGSYRIGYATSSNGIHWQRKDNEAGMTPSTDGWDSTMMCYPYVIEDNNKLIMFYNGNGFGKTGFGYAILD